MDKERLKEALGDLDLVDTVFEVDGVSYIDTAVRVMQVYDLIDQLDEQENVDIPMGRQLRLFDVEPKERHLEIVHLLHKTWVEKNERYGDSFAEVYDELGDVSALTQVLHKVNRLKTLAIDGGDDDGESLDDTLLDLANYCIMWLMER